jgi:hypothetical protein
MKISHRRGEDEKKGQKPFLKKASDPFSFAPFSFALLTPFDFRGSD